MGRIGRNERCPCGSGKKYKKCCEDKAASSSNRFVPPGFTQVLLETAEGLRLRNIPPAMPLRLREAQGKEAENATHGAAATWGLRDFVFKPSLRQLPSGVRELGDGVLLTGSLGVVVQVKSRGNETSSKEREVSWLKKQCRKAARQGSGTIRQFCRQPATLTNMRGRSVEVDGNDIDWVVAVVIDHESVPRGFIPEDHERVVFLLRRDWEFLFEQMKSTHAVGRYLRRVAGEAIALGTEPARYYELAAADHEAQPTPLKPEFQLSGIQEVSEPILPLAPVGIDDAEDHAMFRTILEEIALIKRLTFPEVERIRALADLDRLPPVQRASVGNYLRTGLENVSKIKSPEVLWHLRRVSGGFDATQLGFGACSQFNEEIQWAFGAWLQLRHLEFARRVQVENPVSVGVLLTPRRDGLRKWDTSMAVIRGEIQLSLEELEGFTELWESETDALRATA